MIKATGLVKRYGDKINGTTALKGVNVQIGDGEFAVILGASGSGKSTLLACLSGLERPDEGTVICSDTEITGLTDKQLTKFRRDNVGFVFQQYYLLPNLTVEKNVRLGADLAPDSDYAEIIRAVGLENKKKSYPGALSGGEQQRVAIARALAKKPKILFMDEPTGALDEATGRCILDLVERLMEKYRITVVMVTHNQNIAEMAGVVIKMNSGRICDVCTNSKRKTAYEIGW